MLVGHYGVAMAGKATEPRLPLWVYAFACQFTDFLWSALILAGIERAHVDPALSGIVVVQDWVPISHGLFATLLWSIVVSLLAKLVGRQPWRVASILGGVVLSHWLLDVIGHRPDLPLFWGPPDVGFGLFAVPAVSQAIEVGLLGAGAIAWARQRGVGGRALWPVYCLFVPLVALQAVALLSPPASVAAAARSSVILHLVIIAIAWAVDRGAPGSERAASSRP